MKQLTMALFLLCFLSFAVQAQQVSVNAADYSPNLAPGALASAFGADLASATEAATALPLPTTLAGTRVLVNGKAAPLLFVSAAQINYQLPEDTPAGEVEVVVERGNGNRTRELINVAKSGFAAFSFDASGSGAGAILDGRTFRQGPHETITERGEATILALFGTGLGDVSNKSFVSSRVHVLVGGVEAKVHYAGPQPDFVGLDQINFELPANVANHGTLPVVVKIDEQAANAVTVDVTATEMASLSFAVAESFTTATEIAGMRISPFPDIDTLKVTLRSVNLVSDAGIEVAVLSSPLTVDLLAPEAVARLVKRLNVKPGTYVALTAGIGELVASYKGQAVPMRVANNAVKQALRVPLKLEKETTVGVSFAFDVRASVKKETAGYAFDPVMWLTVLGPTVPPQPLQKFEGKIASIDAAAKQLKVTKGEGTNTTTIVVDASKARLVTSNGRPADFAALKVGDKLEVTGVLNSKGVVEASVLIIGGTPPPPPRPIFATGTINSINLAGQTFELNVESLVGVYTLVPVRKMTIKWDDKTTFADDLRGKLTPDKLLVGHRVSTALASFSDPSLATSVLVMNPHARGTVADVKGLPGSFVVNDLSNPLLAAPVRLITVKLTATTKILNVWGGELKPSDITLGSQVDAVGTLAGTEMTAAFVFVIGSQISGITGEVDVTAKVFVVTDDKGTKTKVGVSDRTTIMLMPLSGDVVILGFPSVRADEFLKLLANKPHKVVVFGTRDSSGLLQAVTIRAEEKK